MVSWRGSLPPVLSRHAGVVKRRHMQTWEARRKVARPERAEARLLVARNCQWASASGHAEALLARKFDQLPTCMLFPFVAQLNPRRVQGRAAVNRQTFQKLRRPADLEENPKKLQANSSFLEQKQCCRNSPFRRAVRLRLRAKPSQVTEVLCATLLLHAESKPNEAVHIIFCISNLPDCPFE